MCEAIRVKPLRHTGLERTDPTEAVLEPCVCMCVFWNSYKMLHVSHGYLCVLDLVTEYVFITGVSAVALHPSGTIVERGVRGWMGDSVFHVMKGNPFGAEANSPQQQAVLEDSWSHKETLIHCPHTHTHAYKHTHIHTYIQARCWVTPVCAEMSLRQWCSVLSSPPALALPPVRAETSKQGRTPSPVLLPILPDTHLPYWVNTETEKKRWKDGAMARWRQRQRAHTVSAERQGWLLWGNLPANLDLSLRLVKIIIVSQAGLETRTKANMSPQRVRGEGIAGKRWWGRGEMTLTHNIAC